MRISDWSSDVCSSDLAVTIADRAPIRHGIAIKRLPDHLMRDASRLARGLLLPRFVALGGGEAAERRFSTAAAHAVIIVAEKGTARLLARGERTSTSLNSSHSCAPRELSSACDITQVYT